jgi:ABC-2 type transport system permease protein
VSGLFASAGVQMRELCGELFMFLIGVLQPAFIALTVMLVLRHRSDFAPMYVIVGSALSGLWSVLLFGGGGIITRERWGGTLELLEATPTPLFVVMAGKMLGTLLFSAAAAGTAYVIGGGLYGYSLRVNEPFVFALGILLAMFALWSIGMLLAPIAVLWRWAQGLLGGFEYPVYVLSGFLFPLALLPPSVTWFSALLPPYWGAMILHGSSTGLGGGPAVPVSVAGLVASSAACVLGSRLLYAYVLRHAKRDGTLAHA